MPKFLTSDEAFRARLRGAKYKAGEEPKESPREEKAEALAEAPSALDKIAQMVASQNQVIANLLKKPDEDKKKISEEWTCDVSGRDESGNIQAIDIRSGDDAWKVSVKDRDEHGLISSASIVGDDEEWIARISPRGLGGINKLVLKRVR
jgi:hypothetical protein